MRALYQAGTIGSRNNDLANAKRWFAELTISAKPPEDAAFEALAHFGEAEVAYSDGEYEAAMTACESSLELFKSTASVGRTARALTLYGLLLNERGVRIPLSKY